MFISIKNIIIIIFFVIIIAIGLSSLLAGCKDLFKDTRPILPLVIDVTRYNGEYRVLEIRLKELYNLVDTFIIGESNTTYSGLSKEFRFETDKNQIDSKLLSKIRYIKDFNTDSDTNIAWVREGKQWDRFNKEWLEYINDNDYIINSDLDEIPNNKLLIKDIKNNIKLVSYKSHWFNFNFNNYLGLWDHYSIKLGKGKIFKEFYATEPTTNENIFRKLKGDLKIGGWHISYFLTPSAILKKLEEYSHHLDKKDMNAKKLGMKGLIKILKEGGDLFGNKRKKYNGDYPKNINNKYFSIID